MKKEEILAKSKQENADGDEREKEMRLKRDAFSGIGMLIFSIIFMTIGIIRNDPALDIITIVFCTSGLRFTYEGFSMKRKGKIAVGLAFLAAALAAFAWYCVRLSA